MELDAPVGGAPLRAVIAVDGARLAVTDRFETVEEFWQVLQAHASRQHVQIPRVTAPDTPHPLALSEQDTEHIPAVFLQRLRALPGTRKPGALLLVLLALLLTGAIAMGLLSYIWGFTLLILLCMGVFLQLLFPLLRKRLPSLG